MSLPEATSDTIWNGYQPNIRSLDKVSQEGLMYGSCKDGRFEGWLHKIEMENSKPQIEEG